MLPSPAALVLLTSSLSVWLVDGISVPTGKRTPITPARLVVSGGGESSPIRMSRAPAPVSEYTEENPEPPPLDPSYTPPDLKFLNALTPNAIYYVPLRLRVPDYRNAGSFDRPKYNVKVLEYRVQTRNGAPPTVDAYAKPDPALRKYQYHRNAAAATANVDKQRQQQRFFGPTKSGYPKKARAYPADYTKYYYHYLHNHNHNNHHNHHHQQTPSQR